MANWDYVLKFIICGDAAVGKSSLLVRLTDQRFLANPDPTVCFVYLFILIPYFLIFALPRPHPPFTMLCSLFSSPLYQSH